jgi:hypothetical protein
MSPCTVEFLQRKGTRHGCHHFPDPEQFSARAYVAGHDDARLWGAHAEGLYLLAEMAELEGEARQSI